MAGKGVECYVMAPMGLAEGGHDVVDNSGGGVRVEGDSFEGEGVEDWRREDVPVVL